MRIRAAELADAPQIGKVHVKVWHETYRGLMPDSVLDRMNADDRAQAWAARIPTFRTNRQTLLVADVDGEIVGFAGCGPRRQETLVTDGEIYMINLLAKAKRHGTGTRLMHALSRALIADGFQSAGLWVLEKNMSARAFYARLGGITGSSQEEDHDGTMLTDLAILWPRVATLEEYAAEAIG